MGQFSMYLLYGAVMLLYWAYAEMRKPKQDRKVAKAALCLVLGLGYFVYAWFTRGAMAMAAAAYNTMYLGAGAVLCVLGLMRAVAPPPHRNRLLAVILVIGGLVLVAFGLGWL